MNLQVLFTGSNAIAIDNAKADLSRRAVIHRLPVLSFRKFLEFETDTKFESYTLDTLIKEHRETFFTSMLSYHHALNYPKQGDFIVDEHYIFEVGGKRKDNRQIKGVQNAYIVSDDIEIGTGDKIPLWLFGFLY